MALQSDDLTALGLGITDDQRPNSLQPVLSDGIYLRYATSFDKGLPWYGFFLFRRMHRSATKHCLAPQLLRLARHLTKESKYAFSGVSMYSGAAIEFIDEFPAKGAAEIALPANAVLVARFEQAPVHRVTARIGFRPGVAKDGRIPAPAPSRTRPPEPTRQVRMIAKDVDAIVGTTIISGRPGEVVTGEIDADRITAVEFRPVAPSRESPKQADYAALVDLCWNTVADALSGKWERVPRYPYPMALPVAEPDYPCAGKPIDPTAAEALALSRVRYGSASNWGGPNFSALHAVLTRLVAGGPGGVAMRNRIDTFVDTAADPNTTPQLTGQNLLQLVQLASLNPAMAQILGLHWVDEQVVAGDAYDYIVLADHGNAFGGDVSAAFAAVNNGLPAGVDAWITFNQVAKPRPPLSAPVPPKTVVLPDTAVNGAVGGGRGAAGLGWDTPSPGAGYLQPDGSIMYLLWRHDHGDAQPPAPPPSATYAALNLDAPYLVGSGSGAISAQSPGNWPPFALHAVDRGLAEGWYSYALSGIDIWGRHSGLSAPGEWHQWAPAPQPEPWYYQNPPDDRQLHGFAVHILDKTPPPPPAAVEAAALDPEDELTYVRDAAYTAWWALSGAPWWNGLTDAQRSAVLPLRVRWRWYPTQQDQHPNTREFRIYFNADSVPPGPDRFDSLNWQERIFVCDYDDHVTLVPQGTGDGPYRQYEVLLPIAPPAPPPFNGVPMQPSLAQPIVYANISVSAADDRTHTGDHAKWDATPWGGRLGNEGVLAAPAKIYRVWRALPAAPLALINDERVWATKADYHSRSFYTFRWAASADLKAHVYSVLDGTLFMAERARTDIAAVSAADIDALKTIWDPAPQSVIDEIAALRTLKAAVGTAWDAACAALSDNALRGLAALPLHEDSYVRQTASPVGDLDFVGPDDPAGYVPNALHCAYKATFDGRARNRYFLRVAYIDGAHNEGAFGPPSPPIYLPPVVPPRTPVIVKVTGGDRSATITWTTANAEAGGQYILYRTDDDYRLRDVRLMDQAATIAAAILDPSAAKAEWTDYGLYGGRTYHYCLVFVDTDGNASATSKPAAVFVPDELPPNPPSWTGQDWMIQDVNSAALLDWPADGVIPAGYRPALRLTWETSTAGPSFVISRSERRRPGWHLVTRGVGTAYPGAQPKQFTCVDAGADPAADLDYRVKVCNAAGLWSREYATQQILAPNPPLGNP